MSVSPDFSAMLDAIVHQADEAASNPVSPLLLATVDQPPFSLRIHLLDSLSPDEETLPDEETGTGTADAVTDGRSRASITSSTRPSSAATSQSARTRPLSRCSSARAVSDHDRRTPLRLLDAMDDHFDRRIAGQEFLVMAASARPSQDVREARNLSKLYFSRRR
jgi:hypothetical protein